MSPVTPRTPAGSSTVPDRIPREIWVLVAAAFVIAIGFGIVAPVLPQFARSFDVGVAAASMIVSIFSLMRLLFAPAGGQLVAKLGERSVYLSGLLIVALSTGACALAQNYTQLMIFRGLGGIGSTMFTVSAVALIVRISPPTIRGRVTSAYATSFLIGNIVGPILGSMMAGLGYRVPFVVYAVALLIAIAVVAKFLSGASLRPPPGTPELEPMTVREALQDRTYRVALISQFANGWSNFGVRIALLPLFAAAIPEIGAPMAGLGLTTFAVGSAGTQWLAGSLADRYGRKPAVITGLLVSGVATGLLGLAEHLTWFVVLSLISGVGAGLLNPAQQATVADIVGADRNGGKVLAATQMVSDLGVIAGPIVAGGLADQIGFGWAFGITGLISIVAALAWIPARETLLDARAEATRGRVEP